MLWWVWKYVRSVKLYFNMLTSKYGLWFYWMNSLAKISFKYSSHPFCTPPHLIPVANWQASVLPLYSLSFCLWKNTAAFLDTLWHFGRYLRNHMAAGSQILALHVLGILLGNWFSRCNLWTSAFSVIQDLLEMHIFWPHSDQLNKKLRGDSNPCYDKLQVILIHANI